VNWRRHAAVGTLNQLLGAVKLRHAAAGEALLSLAWFSLAAWWQRPKYEKVGDVTDVPGIEVVDYCGNDFSVTVRDQDPWVEVVEVAGGKLYHDYKPVPWLPVPPPDPAIRASWLASVLARARAAVRPVEKVSEARSCSVPLRVTAPTVVGPVLSVVDETHTVGEVVATGDLTVVKQRLLRKMMEDQGGVQVRDVVRDRVSRFPSVLGKRSTVPFVEVEPVSALRSDLARLRGGMEERDVVATGYRLAELEVSKTTEGSLSVNDSKRVIPKPRYVRRPVVCAGSEGKRVASQMSLLAAGFKRNLGVPSNRGSVDLDYLPGFAAERVIDVVYRDDWQEVVQRYLDNGMWVPNERDLEDFLSGIDEMKVKKMVDEFFMESEVTLDKWMLMAKGKVKPSREEGIQAKVDHGQTIMYLESSSTNAMYSSMMRTFKKCVDDCLRPEVRVNAQESDVEHENWYNSLESVRKSHLKTYSYASDIRCFDRAQEHPALRSELEFYRRHGLDAARLRLWEQTHGTKKAYSMMFGVVLTVVLGGVSGLWKTLWRNGYVTLAGFVVSTELKRLDVVMMDIKGDDMDVELCRPVNVQTAVERMSLTFNLSAKVFTNDVRYMCKQFRIRISGHWLLIADPWARAQSLLTPVWVGNQEDTLRERWVSFGADMRHYDDEIALLAVAEATQQYYGLDFLPGGLVHALATVAADYGKFVKLFTAPEVVC
jgi:hypothetical protein